jgi:hypothetical protein
MVSVPAGLLHDDRHMRSPYRRQVGSTLMMICQKYDKWVPGFVSEHLASG